MQIKTLPGIVLLTSVGALTSPPCAGADAIAVCYNERPPYLSAGPDGAPFGLTGTPAAHAFKAAGIAVTWNRVPSNRQLAMVKDVSSPSCAIGWFRNAQREQFAKFSKPIYRDKDWMVLVNAEFDTPAGATLEDVLRHQRPRILLKDNFSYGPRIDAMLAQWKPTLAIATGGNSQLMQSISMGTVDFMFVSEDEGRYMLEHAGGGGAHLRLTRFRDMPKGSERHIMCGKIVPDEVMEKLNRAISFK